MRHLATSAQFDPGFAIAGDPLGNALVFMAYGIAVATLGAFLISGCLWASARPRASEPAPRVRRRVIL